MSVDWIDDVVTAAIGDGATVLAGGGVIVRVTNLHEALSAATADSGPSDVLSVAAALGVQVVRTDLGALLGGGATITSGSGVVFDVQQSSSLVVLAQPTAFGSGQNVAAGATLVSINGVTRSASTPAPVVSPVNGSAQTSTKEIAAEAAAADRHSSSAKPVGLVPAEGRMLPETGMDLRGMTAWGLLLLLLGAAGSIIRRNGRSGRRSGY